MILDLLVRHRIRVFGTEPHKSKYFLRLNLWSLALYNSFMLFKDLGKNPNNLDASYGFFTIEDSDTIFFVKMFMTY